MSGALCICAAHKSLAAKLKALIARLAGAFVPAAVAAFRAAVAFATTVLVGITAAARAAYPRLVDAISVGAAFLPFAARIGACTTQFGSATTSSITSIPSLTFAILRAKLTGITLV